MGGEARRDDPCRSDLVESAIHAQESEFRLEIQAVAALRLDRRYAERDHLGEEAVRPIKEGLLVECPRGPHRGPDPASSRGDLQVVPAPDPVGELARPPAAEGEVGVRVHETRDDEAPSGIPLGFTPVFRGKRRGRSGPADDPVPPHEGRVADEPDVVLADRVRAGGETADVREARHGGEPGATRAWAGRRRARGRSGSPPDTLRRRAA